MSRQVASALAMLLACAALARFGARLLRGTESVFEAGYLVHYALATAVVEGRGLCLPRSCAGLPPLYPLSLVPSVVLGKSALVLIVVQSLVGTATCAVAFALGRRLFDARVGLIACGLCAFYPYYVVHDTALQDTSLHTLAVALAVLGLVRAGQDGRPRDFVLAGALCGAALLVRISSLPLFAVALLWTAIWGARAGARARLALLLLLGFSCVVGPWVVRNRIVTGRAVLTTQLGGQLHRGQNPDTFSAYPARSIDRSAERAWSALPEPTRRALTQQGELEQNDAYLALALAHVLAHPGEALLGGARKVAAAFSPQLNPRRSWPAQLVYALGYVPVALLGLWGLWRERRREEVKLLWLLIASFAGVAAVFYAHTSHRSHLDVYVMLLAAAVLDRLHRRGRGSSPAQRVGARATSPDMRSASSRSA